MNQLSTPPCRLHLNAPAAHFPDSVQTLHRCMPMVALAMLYVQQLHGMLESGPCLLCSCSTAQPDHSCGAEPGDPVQRCCHNRPGSSGREALHLNAALRLQPQQASFQRWRPHASSTDAGVCIMLRLACVYNWPFIVGSTAGTRGLLCDHLGSACWPPAVTVLLNGGLCLGAAMRWLNEQVVAVEVTVSSGQCSGSGSR